MISLQTNKMLAHFAYFLHIMSCQCTLSLLLPYLHVNAVIEHPCYDNPVTIPVGLQQRECFCIGAVAVCCVHTALSHENWVVAVRRGMCCSRTCSLLMSLWSFVSGKEYRPKNRRKHIGKTNTNVACNCSQEKDNDLKCKTRELLQAMTGIHGSILKHLRRFSHFSKCKELSLKFITCCTTIALQIMLESIRATPKWWHRQSGGNYFTCYFEEKNIPSVPIFSQVQDINERDVHSLIILSLLQIRPLISASEYQCCSDWAFSWKFRR